MEKQVFIVRCASNEAFKSYFYNEIMSIHESVEGANSVLDKIEREVDNKTSKHFLSEEFGWINVKADRSLPKYSVAVRGVTYKWIDPTTSAECYTHFTITPMRLDK